MPISATALKRLLLAMAAYWMAKKLYNAAFNGPRRVRGKRVLITGGAGGIGLCAAKAFRRAGARAVVLWDVNREALANAERELAAGPSAAEGAAGGCDVHAYAVDLSSRESVYETAERVKAEVSCASPPVGNAAHACSRAG